MRLKLVSVPMTTLIIARTHVDLPDTVVRPEIRPAFQEDFVRFFWPRVSAFQLLKKAIDGLLCTIWNAR